MKMPEERIDLDSWSRKEHFEFYRNMRQPNFNVCTQIDALKLYKYCKVNGHSFFNAYLFLTQQALNSLENLKYRIRDNEVIRCREIGINAVHLLKNGTFRFTYIDYQKNFRDFCEENRRAITEASNDNFISKAFEQNQDKLNTVYLSVLPWLNFSGFTHAADDKLNNGVPKIVFGKLDSNTGKMSLSVELHHGLADGYHLGQFVDKLQMLFNTPDELL